MSHMRDSTEGRKVTDMLEMPQDIHSKCFFAKLKNEIEYLMLEDMYFCCQ